MASALRKAQTHDDQVHGSLKMKVTILASEWRSSNGGLSTINRELAIQLAKFPEVEITLFLPKCSREDKKVALDHKVKIVEATPLSGFEQLDWLCFPPEDLQIDIVVGHGVKLGKQAQVIKKSKTCKWVQVVHTDPEELGMFKNYPNPISKGEEKHKIEVELCEMADHVVGVGPKLSEAFRSYLCGCHKDGKVFDLTPGVFEEFETVKQVSPSDRQQRRVLVFGRGDAEDFELKGFDIAGKAIAALQDTVLVFVGAPDGKHEEIANRLIECGVPASRLRVRGFVQDRESLKRLFQEVDLVVMPSRTEGFGLTGLEAMSAGLPVLVSRNSGFGEALRSAAFGSSFVIDSEVPAIWTVAIQNILSKDRECRLEEAVTLRDSYGRKYNWAKQIKELVDKMICLTHATEDSRKARSSFETKCNASQRMESMTEDHEGTSSEDSGVFFKKQMPSKIASHEDASSLGKEPLNSWSMQNIAGSTSNIDSQSTASSDGAKKQKGDLSTEEPASKISKTTSSSNPSDADHAEDATSGISNDETKSRKTDSNAPEVDVAVLTNKELPKTSKRLDLEQLPIDILLFTVKDCEFLACLSLLTGFSRMFQKELGDVYIGNIGEMKIAVMKCRMGAAGPGSAAGVVRDAVKALTPKAVFCVGYCGGLQPVNIKLGDVVISEVLITYAPSKVTKDGIEERGHRVPLKPNLARVILNAAAGWSAPLRDPAELEVAQVRGALLSGPQVVDDSDLREALLNRFPGAIAIEMEGEGVYSAAHDLNVEWIIIKGVSDFADGKNSEINAWQPFASIMAASFVAHILSNSIIFEDWPHYNNGKTSLPPSSGNDDKEDSFTSDTSKQ